MLLLEIALRFVKSSWIKELSLTSKLTVIGFVIGVASLIVSMSVVEGFEQSLFKSIVRINSHLQIRKTFYNEKAYQEYSDELKKKYSKEVTHTQPVLWSEALAIAKGQLKGVLLQGLNFPQVLSVLELKGILESGGSFEPELSGDTKFVWIGKGLAQLWDVNVGDEISLVVPIYQEMNPQSLRRSYQKFKIAGILHFGKFEYDERFILLKLNDLQDLAKVGAQISGVLVKLSDYHKADRIKDQITQASRYDLIAQSWKDVNSFLFEAIRIERYIIFFVILIIIIASSFNIGVALWVGVIQKTREISVLRVLGLSQRQIQIMLIMEGLILSLLGSIVGLLLGLLLTWGVDYVLLKFELLPGSVYHLDSLQTQVQMSDILLIFFSVIVLSVSSIYWPARAASKKILNEGLKYE